MHSLRIVEEWSDWLSDLMELWDPKSPDACDQANDLLALWLGFKRFKPALVEKVCSIEDLAWLQNKVEPGLAEQALKGQPDMALWVEAAKKLSDSYEEDVDPAHRAELARELLWDLDRAELVDMAVRRLTSSAEPDQGIEDAVAFCAQNADVFLAAAWFARSTLESFKEDLAYDDPDLALTALKFVSIDRAAEEARSSLEAPPQMEAQTAKALAEAVKDG